MPALILLMLFLFLFPLISATIVINQQPEKIYNLGDVISIPVKIVASENILGSLNVDLICSSKTTNYKIGIPSLSAGENYNTDIYVPLTKSEIGETKGKCEVKVYLGGDSALTNEFKISDLILLNANFPTLEFNPGDILSIEGQATKENGEPIEGFLELSIVEGNNSVLSGFETVDNGVISINTTLPKGIKAGSLLLKLEAYEKDSDNDLTNKGFLNQNIRINQVPTSLEVVFETKNVEPGTNLKTKAVLHDQTGKKIFSSSIITIKNKDGKTMEQKETITDEFFKFPILYNEAPGKWEVSAESSELTGKSFFTITEKEALNIKIINKTLTIANAGNIPYNKTALIKIGNNTLKIDLYLKVDESQKYIITAPDGNYNVEVIAGDNTASEEVLLTGKSVDVKKAPGKIGGLIKYPLVWIFVILILGFIAFMAYKRGYKKTFIGHESSKKGGKKEGQKDELIQKGKFVPKSKLISKNKLLQKGKLFPLAKGSFINSRNKAELSLSIKGDKQNTNIIALHIKNLGEIQKEKGNAKEAIQKIVNLAEENKAVTYESHSTLFFILAPTKTRTFKNEKMALEIANKIKDELINHNKMAKQKISFGISLNYGAIVAKQDENSFKFMSFGTLLNTSKKIASSAKEEILLSEKVNDLFGSSIKTKKSKKNKINAYSVEEIRNVEEHKKFIRNFLNRIEGKNNKEKKKDEKKN